MCYRTIPIPTLAGARAQVKQQMNITPKEIIDFWFSDKVKKRWFSSTPEFDKRLTEKYEAVWEKASSGGLDEWSDDPDGCLALLIILDQFPLNMFRGQAFSQPAQPRYGL